MRLRLRDGSGALSGQEFSLSMSSIKHKDPPKNAYVKIISGEYQGQSGTVKVMKFPIFLFMIMNYAI